MIKIRLAIIDNDAMYSERLRLALSAKYENSIELYHFSNVENFVSMLSNLKLDVILVDEAFDISTITGINNASIAYLCSSNDVSTLHGENAVSKFQKIEDFYKCLLSLYSEKSDKSGIKFDFGEGGCKLTLFTSSAGGVGTSTLAAAYAVRLAKKGKKPLYLNLQTFGDVLDYFQAPGMQTLSDIIYALKSKKINLSLKLQSSVKTDDNGVSFFDHCPLPLDMLEMNESDYSELINTLMTMSNYDEIIVDTGCHIASKDLMLMGKAHSIIVVSDGSTVANAKVESLLKSLAIMDDQNGTNISAKVNVFYNKFSSKTSSQLQDVSYIGGVSKFEGFPVAEIINRISAVDELDKI